MENDSRIALRFRSVRAVVLVLLTAVAFGLSGCVEEAGKETAGASGSKTPDGAAAQDRLRVVVLSDFPPLDVNPDSGPAHKRSDPDDVQSMVRFLLYANEFDVEGLVASSATFANIANKQNIADILDLYDAVDENLRKHDARYPTADRLRSVTWEGSSGCWGNPADDIIGPGKDSEASEAIIALLDKPDSRPLHFGVWGGSCDLAQALWKIKETRSVRETEELLAKVRVYLIALQDGTGQWLLDTFPKLYAIPSKSTWQGMFGTSDLAWLDANVRKEHGVLGAVYPEKAMGTAPGVKEGDSPSFLYLASAVRGLNDPERPDQPSWGGQFVRAAPDRNHWIDSPAGGETVRRWSEHFDNDFAARMDWCVKDFDDANHPPRAEVTGSLKRAVKAGDTVKLEATVTDADGDQLTSNWRQYDDSAAVTIANSDSLDEASFIVPNEPGKEIRITLEVIDNGTPPLVDYQSIVFAID